MKKMKKISEIKVGDYLRFTYDRERTEDSLEYWYFRVVELRKNRREIIGDIWYLCDRKKILYEIDKDKGGKIGFNKGEDYYKLTKKEFNKILRNQIIFLGLK